MRKVLLFVVLAFVISGCGKEESKIAFPFIPPKKIFGGTTLNFLVKFDKNINRAWGEDLPSNADFKRVGSQSALFQYSPGVTETGVKQFKLFATSSGKTVSGIIQVTVLKPNLRINYPPVLSVPDEVVVKEGESVDFYVAANDPEGEPVTVKIENTNISGYVFDGKRFIWHTDYESSGNYFVKFSTTDGIHKVTAVTSIIVQKSSPDPLLYVTSVSYVIHEGEKFETQFARPFTDSSEKVYLEKKIDGMDLKISGKVVKFTFIPGFGYKNGNLVRNAIISENQLHRRVINLTFKIIDEGAILLKTAASNFLLSPPISHRYAFFITSAENGGGLTILDYFSDYPVAETESLKNCQQFLYAGALTDGVLIYSCRENSNQIIKSVKVIDGNNLTFSLLNDVNYSISGNTFLKNYKPFWLGMEANFLFTPDYTSSEKVKFLRVSTMDSLFITIPDYKWVKEPSATYSPLLHLNDYGIKFITDKGQMLVAAGLIDNWNGNYQNISSKLAVFTYSGKNVDDARVLYVTPVTLPADFVEVSTTYNPIYLSGAGRFILLDATDYRGYSGFFTGIGVKFDPEPIVFYKKVEKLLVINDSCFLALYEGGLDGQKYCFVGSSFRPIGGEMDFSPLTVNRKVLSISIEAGRVFMVVRGGDGKLQLLYFPEVLMK